jgi:hypothetical protein
LTPAGPLVIWPAMTITTTIRQNIRRRAGLARAGDR